MADDPPEVEWNEVAKRIESIAEFLLLEFVRALTPANLGYLVGIITWEFIEDIIITAGTGGIAAAAGVVGIKKGALLLKVRKIADLAKGSKHLKLIEELLELLSAGRFKSVDELLQHVDEALAKLKADAPNRGAWGLADDLLRGKLLEVKLGKNTPDQFPYFDEWQSATGTATSIKTTRLDRQLSALESDLRKWVREIAEFPPKVQAKGFIKRGGLQVDLSAINQRGLRVGIEPGIATPAQLKLFERIKEYGKQMKLKFVDFVEVR